MALDDFPKINHDSQASGEQGSVVMNFTPFIPSGKQT